jgi:hypothetical protein
MSAVGRNDHSPRPSRTGRRKPCIPALQTDDKAAYKEDMEPTKWRYTRDDITDLSQLDDRLVERGNLGWELVTILHSEEAKTTEDQNILAPPKWTLLFKQPAS